MPQEILWCLKDCSKWLKEVLACFHEVLECGKGVRKWLKELSKIFLSALAKLGLTGLHTGTGI